MLLEVNNQLQSSDGGEKDFMLLLWHVDKHPSKNESIMKAQTSLIWWNFTFSRKFYLWLLQIKPLTP